MVIHRLKRSHRQPEFPQAFREKYWFIEEELAKVLQTARCLAGDEAIVKPERCDLEVAGERCIAMLYQATPEKPLLPIDSLKITDTYEATLVASPVNAAYPRWYEQGLVGEIDSQEGHRHIIREQGRRVVSKDLGGFYPLWKGDDGG